jgi:hypothetical protein
MPLMAEIPGAVWDTMLHLPNTCCASTEESQAASRIPIPVTVTDLLRINHFIVVA